MNELTMSQFANREDLLVAQLEAERAKLAEAQAMIAMQHAALNEAHAICDGIPTLAHKAKDPVLAHLGFLNNQDEGCLGYYAIIRDACSATAETVSAWEADKQEKWNEESNSLIGQQDIEIENLRGEVAMLRGHLSPDYRNGTAICDVDKVLNDTQTTALAYEETIRKAERERILNEFQFFKNEGAWLAKAIREMK